MESALESRFLRVCASQVSHKTPAVNLFSLLIFLKPSTAFRNLARGMQRAHSCRGTSQNSAQLSQQHDDPPQSVAILAKTPCLRGTVWQTSAWARRSRVPAASRATARILHDVFLHLLVDVVDFQEVVLHAQHPWERCVQRTESKVTNRWRLHSSRSPRRLAAE